MSPTYRHKIFKIWQLWIFLFKKPGDFNLNREILQTQKNEPQAVSSLFQSVSSSIEVILGTSHLVSFNACISILLYSTKNMLRDENLEIGDYEIFISCEC